MYVTGKNRYDNYKSRYDVYLFTLRDYTEVLLDKFGGSYIERSDMPIHSGYLLQFINLDSAKQFIASIAESSTEVSDKVTTYVLPHLEGNTLPLYATIKDEIDIVYIGLSDYPEALDKYGVNDSETLQAPSVDAEADDVDMFGTLVGDMQENLQVTGGRITGTLKYLSEGALVDRWGAGNFMGIKFVSSDWSQYTSVKVGMNPSHGDGLVEIINDPDKNGAFKVTDTAQQFVVVYTNGSVTKTENYNLSGLTLLSE